MFLYPRSAQVGVIQAVLMSFMITVTGTGNALVILGFVINKKLRTPSNYFLLNLAISDFFTGVFTLPLYLNNYIINGKWVHGKDVCKLWLTIDYTLCQSTIYNIVLISSDRFLAVTKAVSIQSENKMKPAFLKMAAVWILAFLNFGPAIIIWEYAVGYSLLSEGDCNPEFFYSGHYLLYSSIFDFFTPMTAIAFFNLSIYFNIRSRTKYKVQRNLAGFQEPTMSSVFVVDCTNVISRNMPSVPHETTPSVSRNSKILQSLSRICKTNHHSPDVRDETKNSALAKDKKMAKSLSVLVCTFSLCWAPYCFLTIVREGFCTTCISPVLYDVTCWLFFLNSSINPFIYPLCHPVFFIPPFPSLHLSHDVTFTKIL
uniref:G-protein coupled receptors family 1 profile domain-containing protein n=1 Tax=Leptobrachium leishanense TaxID=445787 RepID=A0A8C5MEY1_9ANUR